MSRARKRPAAAAPAQVAVPLAPKTLWRLLIGGFALLGTTAALVWALAAKVPQQATLSVATAASDAGFVVRQVDIDGAVNQPRLSIYREVLDGGSDSMLLADLPAIRARLLELPWVKDATIQRRWPDRIDIRIVERKPAAIWQHKGRMRLIDTEGVVLPADDLQPFAALPLLVGADAQMQAAELLRLLADHPKLADDMQAALWVGQRRWDIRMKSGETISLPEGPAARVALTRFADIDRETPLLGRGFVRFDLRIPDKMVVRVGGEAGARPRPTPAPAVPKAPATETPPAARAVPQATEPAPVTTARLGTQGEVVI
jgi:cell division protein FtsQ